jgi:cation diffusion facilitator family transporter
MASSKSVVLAALVANGLIAITKFIGFLLTGSPSMLSETYHSLSDTGNQVLLLTGLQYGKTTPTEHHPYGRGKAQFFYSFLVSVFLFGIAGVSSAKHGYTAIKNAVSNGDHHAETTDVIIQGVNITELVPVELFWINIAVLTAAFLFESYAMYKATKGIKRIQKENGYTTFIETFKKTTNVTTLTAFTEDFVALLGILLAFIGVISTQYLGNPIYDAATSLIIGILLMGAAIALAWENKRLILGENMQPSDEEKIKQTLLEFTEITSVSDLRTLYFGPDTVLVNVRVKTQENLTSDEIESVITQARNQLKTLNKDIKTVYIEPIHTH